MCAGLRHGRTLGTPLALVVPNRDHENWRWGMSLWPPEGEPEGKGTKPVTLPRPGHADLAGALKFGHGDVRDTLERASARQTAITVAAGAVCKALLRELGVEVTGSVLEMGDVDSARADRDTVGGVVEVRARAVPPGLGSYATKEDRLDARLAAALMGIQAVKGVEIGDGFGLAGLRGSQAHDEILPGLRRETNRAGGIEGGVSNGEEIVARAAMKPLPTLMRPLRSVDLGSGEPAEALVERSDVAAVEALAVVAEASVAFELAVLRARSSAATRSTTSSRRTGRTSTASHGARPRPPPRTHRLHGRRQDHARLSRRRPDRKAVLRPRPGDREVHAPLDPGSLSPGGGEGLQGARGGGDSRTLRRERPAVVALGGGAIETPAIREALREHALTVLVEVEVDAAWDRVARSARPLASDQEQFRQLYEGRKGLYDEVADARARTSRTSSSRGSASGSSLERDPRATCCSPILKC